MGHHDTSHSACHVQRTGFLSQCLLSTEQARQEGRSCSIFVFSPFFFFFFLSLHVLSAQKQ